MNERHYTTGELLSHAYLPDDTGITAHLAACESCGDRFAEIREGIRAHASSEGALELPETFWKRQELAVMRAVERRGRRMPGVGAQLAAAAALILVVASFVAGRGSVAPAGDQPVATVTSTIAAGSVTAAASAQENALTSSQITTDPWQSEQLEDFQSVVDWENWVEDDTKNRGTI